MDAEEQGDQDRVYDPDQVFANFRESSPARPHGQSRQTPVRRADRSAAVVVEVRKKRRVSTPS